MNKLFCLLALLSLSVASPAQGVLDRTRRMEAEGNAAEARKLLKQAADLAPQDAQAQLNYAEFLDRYHGADAARYYENALKNMPASDQRRGKTARRLVLLSLVANDEAAAARHLNLYRESGGTDWAFPAQRTPAPTAGMETIAIPGPLVSFARMAALSPDIRPEDMLPALARNVVTSGYQASMGSESLEPTEYLKLVVRYLSQARELQSFSGAEKRIRIAKCDSEQTGELLRILGYRMRGGCGAEVVLETVNATRAFLTIDSGFPLADLEQALRTDRPFDYDYSPTLVPVMYTPQFWMALSRNSQGEFIDAVLADPQLCRLYLGLAKLPPPVAGLLKDSVDVRRLRAVASTLDFYGGMFDVRGGKVVVPGGAQTEQAWAKLVGARVDQPAEFFDKLLAKDDGWLASYFDALSRVEGGAQNYLTDPDRLERFYLAIRGRVTSPGPARPVFRANADMMLLTTRLQMDRNGLPFLPGTLDIWKTLFARFPGKRIDKKLQEAAPGWKNQDDVVEALFALCRKSVENEPLKIFMTLSELDRRREKKLAPETVNRLAWAHRNFSDIYPTFADVPTVSDENIMRVLDAAEAMERVRNAEARMELAGTFQAALGLWQILARQGSIPPANADAALGEILSAFDPLYQNRSLSGMFTAARTATDILLKYAGYEGQGGKQRFLLAALAGKARAEDTETQTSVVQEMARVLEAQRLVSLDDLIAADENLQDMAAGKAPNTQLFNQIDQRLSELAGARESLSAVERNTISYGYWSERHIAKQRKFRFSADVIKAGNSQPALTSIREQLQPLLRDALVGLNYAYYAPPGAQVLYTNPTFVRSHDFIGAQGANQTWGTTEVQGSGWPSNSGGRLVGSLFGLGYALAVAEQNFLVPTREQALIWGDLVPQLIVSAKSVKWWDVSPRLMHWVALHQRYGMELIAEAMLNPTRREQVLASLYRQAAPVRAGRVKMYLESFDLKDVVEHVTPSELYLVAKDAMREAGGDDSPLAAEIRAMAASAPAEINYEAVSRAFGTPKPTLTKSYYPELLHLRTFPTLMGYSSRILAESWESSHLYFAALADETHARPAQLNLLVPQWTRRTAENIFATHLEDWPALLRSLRSVGREVRSAFQKQENTEQRAGMN